MKSAFNSPYLLWLILTIPLLIMTWAHVISGSMIYGEYLHVTGEYSARLLILTMAVTPLQLMFGRTAWIAWLVKSRRYFGVAAFGYAVPHLLVYAFRLGVWADIWADAADPGLWTGWVAFFIFIALAVTSNNLSMRKLGRSWKTLHRLVYIAAILTFVHWYLVAFDPVPGLIHAGILVALELVRLGIQYWPRRQSVA